MRHKIIKQCVTLLTLLAISSFQSIANAKEFWSDTSLSLLYGQTYKVPFTLTTTDSTRYVITFEHISDNSWGDFFTFLDISRSAESQRNNLYGELTPRLSLFKISNYKPNKDTFLQDLLLAVNLEYTNDVFGTDFLNILAGVGTNVKVPGFQFVQLNFYRRSNQRSADNWQFTPVFAVPFSLGAYDFRVDGWADFVSATRNVSSNIHTQIQMKIDAGKILMKKPDTFYLGTEYKYWRNKFGITGIQENVWQLLAQVHF